MQIAIDGPAGVGKSTLAKALAEKLNYIYIDTGAMYRGVAHVAHSHGVSPDDLNGLQEILEGLSLHFEFVNDKKSLFNHDENIEDVIRQSDISKIVSQYAKIDIVREEMKRQQQNIAAQTSVVMDGRDIGTVILPNATFKFFLTASPEERTKRRFLELKNRGIDVDFNELLSDIKKRDAEDENRLIAPLKKADDAIVINTDNLDEKQVLDKILDIIKNNVWQ